MLNRKAWTTATAITASLISGAVAVGATVGHTPFTSVASGKSPPTAASASVGASPTASPAAPAVPADPAAALWFAGLATNAGAANPSAPGAVTDPAEPAHASTPTARPSTSTTQPDSPPPGTPPPTAAPTTTTTSPLFNCSGSDDGLPEAYKHAREEWCHAHGGSDD